MSVLAPLSQTSTAAAPPLAAAPPAAAEASAGASTDEAAAAAEVQKDFDSDASKYTLKDLLQFQQQQNPIFRRLNYTRVKPEIFNRLFPLSPGQLLPPRGFRVSTEMIGEWRTMARGEQEKYKERTKKAEERQQRSAKRSGTIVPQAIVNNKRNARVTNNPIALALMEVPVVPPLSRPIPFLHGKLSQVKQYYRHVPDGFTEWTNGAAVHQTFPPPRGCSKLQIPQCILQDAHTNQDKLTVLSWWRFLTKEEQRVQNEGMKRIYATPKVNNRKLPHDFWKKMEEHERNRGRRKAKDLVGPIDPTGNDFYVHRGKKKEEPKPKDTSCGGWRGEKFEKLFQACFLEAAKDVSMVGSAKIFETIPVSESVTRSKYAKDVVFLREGDDYVLRSVGCTKKREEGKQSRFCPSCQGVAPHVNHVKRNIQTAADVEAQQKAQITSLKAELKSTQRREKRLREKLNSTLKNNDDDDDVDEPTPKKQRAEGPPTHSAFASPRRLPMASVQQRDNGHIQHNLFSPRDGSGFSA